jgi:hypothetical protein
VHGRVVVADGHVAIAGEDAMLRRHRAISERIQGEW